MTPDRQDTRRRIPLWAVARIVGLCLVAGLFLYAGVAKLDRPELFAIDIYSFDLVSWETSAILAYAIPITEILAAILACIPFTRRLGLGILAAMLLGFTGLLSWALWMGLDVACGCLGAGSGEIPFAVLRNAVLLAITGALIVTHRPRSHASGMPESEQKPIP